jgi:hypothetical protein
VLIGYEFLYWLKRAFGARARCGRHWRAVLAHLTMVRAADPTDDDLHAGARHQEHVATRWPTATLDPRRRRAWGWLSVRWLSVAYTRVFPMCAPVVQPTAPQARQEGWRERYSSPAKPSQ